MKYSQCSYKLVLNELYSSSPPITSGYLDTTTLQFIFSYELNRCGQYTLLCQMQNATLVPKAGSKSMP